MLAGKFNFLPDDIVLRRYVLPGGSKGGELIMNMTLVEQGCQAGGGVLAELVPLVAPARVRPFVAVAACDAICGRIEAKLNRLTDLHAWVLPPEVQMTAHSAMFVPLHKDGTESRGCGCFISGKIALTFSHIRKECAEGDKLRARSLNGTALSFTIRYDDGDNDHADDGNFQAGRGNLDFLVLELDGAPLDQFFRLTSLTSAESLIGNRYVSLLACRRIDGKRSSVDLARSRTVCHAAITRVGGSHFVYGDYVWDCDSGWCILFDDMREVVGIHLAGLHRTRELLRHPGGMTEDASELLASPAAAAGSIHARTDDGMRAVTASLNDIIGTTAPGGLALFVGCDAVRKAVAYVEGGSV